MPEDSANGFGGRIQRGSTGVSPYPVQRKRFIPAPTQPRPTWTWRTGFGGNRRDADATGFIAASRRSARGIRSLDSSRLGRNPPKIQRGALGEGALPSIHRRPGGILAPPGFSGVRESAGRRRNGIQRGSTKLPSTQIGLPARQSPQRNSAWRRGFRGGKILTNGREFR